MIAEFDDPRLVAIYDAVNAYGKNEQPDFYAQVAADVGATAIVELGCGTGLVASDLATRGYRVTGVDPSSEMLAVARRRQGADQVVWIHGGASSIGAPRADLAVMAGHVAQFLITDHEWRATLAALHDALRPGGTLAFETRNPRLGNGSGGPPGASARSTSPTRGASTPGRSAMTCATGSCRTRTTIASMPLARR